MINFFKKNFAKCKNSLRICHPELVSGSDHQQQCSAICSQKSNVGVETPTYFNFSRNVDQVCPTYKMPCRAAFTLAEVLITLGIIGVVAAMTLPNLVAKYQHMVSVTRLKKMYSVMSQALMRSVPDGDYHNIPITGGGFAGATEYFDNYLKPQFNIIKDCGVNTNGCWVQTVDKSGNTPNISDSWGIGSGSYNFITADGYAVSLDTWDAIDFETFNQWYGVKTTGVTNLLTIAVDINGMQKPNMFGKDVFAFVLTEKGFIPAGKNKTNEEIEAECKTIGLFCFEKIVRNNWEVSKDKLW